MVDVSAPDPRTSTAAPELNRSLSLAHATLYGLGVTIGAGIYVLIGAAAAHSAMQAPIAFVVAALVMSLTAASFAELVGRLPVAAGEAAYAKLAFNVDWFATGVGLFVVGIAIVSASAISVGAAGYIAVFVKLPMFVLIAAVVLAMGAIAAWGIKESIVFAGAMTLIEIGGLVFLIVAGMVSLPDLYSRLPEALPSFSSPATMGALLSTTLLAVFAFIGFEKFGQRRRRGSRSCTYAPQSNFAHPAHFHHTLYVGGLGSHSSLFLCPNSPARVHLWRSFLSA